MKKKLLIIFSFTFIILFTVHFLIMGEKPINKDDKLLRCEINALNEELEANGYEWRAAITSMTRLSPEERALRCGAFKPYFDPDKIKLYQYDPKAGIPTSLNWCSYNGKNWVTPIRNQGSCGSCWAFGSVAIAESIRRVEKNNSGLALDFSEQHLVSCVPGDNSCNGGYASDALKYMKNNKISNENCFPYEAADVSCSKVCQQWKNNKGRIGIAGYEWITYSTANVNKIMNALQHGPVVGWMDVYNDFYSYNSGVYEVSPSTYDTGENHIIALVGYNSSSKYFICKNSWGSNWGESGFFKIRFGESGIGLYVLRCWGITINNTAPKFTSASTANQQVREAATLSFQIQAIDTEGDTVTYSSNNLPSGASLISISGQISWTPTYEQAGVYNVKFTASDGQASSSKTLQIIVINVKQGKKRF